MYDQLPLDEKTKSDIDKTSIQVARWSGAFAVVYFASWFVVFVVERFIADTACSEDGLAVFSKVAFWLITVALVIEIAYLILLSTIRTFFKIETWKLIVYYLFATIVGIISLGLFIAAWVIAVKSTNEAGCGGLFYTVYGYAIITTVLIGLACIGACIVAGCMVTKATKSKDPVLRD